LPSIDITEKPDGSGKTDQLNDTSLKGLLMGRLQNLALTIPVTAADAPLKLYFKDNTMEDLWLAITWGT
jgi:hypothetical protein